MSSIRLRQVRSLVFADGSAAGTLLTKNPQQRGSAAADQSRVQRKFLASQCDPRCEIRQLQAYF